MVMLFLTRSTTREDAADFSSSHFSVTSRGPDDEILSVKSASMYICIVIPTI